MRNSWKLALVSTERTSHLSLKKDMPITLLDEVGADFFFHTITFVLPLDVMNDGAFGPA